MDVFNRISFPPPPPKPNFATIPAELRTSTALSHGLRQTVYYTSLGLMTGLGLAVVGGVTGRVGQAGRKVLVGFCTGVGIGRGEWTASRELEKVWKGDV